MKIHYKTSPRLQQFHPANRSQAPLETASSNTQSKKESLLDKVMHGKKGRIVGGLLVAGMAAGALAGCGNTAAQGNIVNWLQNSYPNAQCSVHTYASNADPNSEAFVCVVPPRTTQGNVNLQNPANYQNRYLIQKVENTLAANPNNAAEVTGYLSDYYPNDVSVAIPVPKNPEQFYRNFLNNYFVDNEMNIEPVVIPIPYYPNCYDTFLPYDGCGYIPYPVYGGSSTTIINVNQNGSSQSGSVSNPVGSSNPFAGRGSSSSGSSSSNPFSGGGSSSGGYSSGSSSSNPFSGGGSSSGGYSSGSSSSNPFSGGGSSSGGYSSGSSSSNPFSGGGSSSGGYSSGSSSSNPFSP